MKYFLLLVLLFPACAETQSALTNYNSHVSERSDSLSGYAKDDSYGVGFTHTVKYK